MTYKMKGYSYPGKSPLRKGEATAIPVLPPKPLAVDSTDSIQKPSKSYEETSSEIKGEKKAARKAKTKEFLGNLGGQAGKALISAGISAGVNALTRPKKKKTRRNTSNGGFTDINFGRNS
tara:strand:+ start:1505 stop:1864 length:360 start_codon:yes stop_codon:yes gene_type:complete